MVIPRPPEKVYNPMSQTSQREKWIRGVDAILLLRYS
jgi:uncharacterized protein YndB with AHSA1/START domain